MRKIHFLAQIIHESASLSATLEYGADINTAYGGFPGRGLMQVTGKTNYNRYGLFAKEDFSSNTENKQKLEGDPHAAKSAGWFWDQEKRLNDEAEANDFIYITRIINGGFNGLDHRLEVVKRGFEILYGSCSYCQNQSARYEFKDSKAFNDKRAAFAWGLWHDLDLNKEGCTKDSTKAIEGYERLLALTSNSFSDTNWYLIRNLPQLISIRYSKKANGVTKYYVKVRKAAEKRLEILKD